MFGRRRIERFETRQEALLEQVGHITAALIAREPGTALSANAYEGLRKQVSIAARDRRQHLARLVELMDAIDRGATTDTLRRKCEQWCNEVGLEAVTDLDRAEPHWFQVVEGEGPELEVLTPAWADAEAGHLVQRGTARRVRPEPDPQPAPPEATAAGNPEEVEVAADRADEADEAETGEAGDAHETDGEGAAVAGEAGDAHETDGEGAAVAGEADDRETAP